MSIRKAMLFALLAFLACVLVTPLVRAQEANSEPVPQEQVTDESSQSNASTEESTPASDGTEGDEGDTGVSGTPALEGDGSTKVKTGDSSAQSDTETEANTNDTSVQADGGDTGIEIVNKNNATSTTAADILSTTGDNSAGGASAIVTTGDALASANVVNVINTNIVNSTGLLYFLNLLFGHAAIDLRDLFTLYENPTLADSPCSLDECEGGDTTLTITNTNTAEVTNDVIVRAETGGNSATAEGGSASVTTGDAYAAANVLNLVNTNIVGSNYLLIAVNNFGDFVNDIVFPGAEFFADLFSDTSGSTVGAGATVSSTNDNTAAVVNNLAVGADTGGNTASTSASSTGSAEIVTGDATSQANVVNQVNTNIFGDSLLILFRIHGTFSGDIFGLPEGVTWAETPTGVELMFDPSAFAGSGGAMAGAGDTVAVANTNTATVTNNVSVYALTGENSAVSTGGSASVTTGDAHAAANVVNLVNTNIFGKNWILAIFNIFGDFSGNITFGRPDLWVGARAEVPTNLEAGACFDYELTVTNFGDAKATNITLDAIFDKALQKLSRFDEEFTSKIRYNLGSLAAGASKDVTVPTCLTESVAPGSTVETSFTASSREPDENRDNNTEEISLVTIVRGGGTGSGGGGSLRLGPSKLALTKTASVEEITASSSVDYKVTIKNTGDPVYHALLVDTIYDEKGKAIHEQRWGLDTIKKGEEIEVTYTVEYAASTTPGLYRNEAFISGVDGNPDYEHNLGTPTKSPVASSTIRIIASEVAEEDDVVCVEYLTSPIKRGAENPVSEVLKLQYFLNTYESFKLRLTGTYDESTYAAVHAFQRKYASDILTPWGATETTGFVYHTTKKKVNELYCEGKREFPLSDVQVKEIDTVRRALTTMRRENTAREQGQDNETPEPLINLSEIGTAAPAPEHSERLLAVSPSTQATSAENADQVAAAAEAIVSETTGGILTELKKRISSMFSWMGR